MNECVKLLGGALVAAVLFAGCPKGGGLEGKYTLDKAAMKAQMQGEIDKMPKDQQPVAQSMLAFVDMLDVKLELAPGGKMTMTASGKGLMDEEDSEAKTEIREGSWKKDGEKIVLEVQDEKSISCTQKGAKLECGDEREKMTMVFSKG